LLRLHRVTASTNCAGVVVPEVPLKVSCESDFVLSFSVDPFPDIRRATAELDAPRLTPDEKPDHIEVYQRYFLHLHSDGGPGRRDLSVKLREVLGCDLPDQPDDRAIRAPNEFNPDRHGRSIEQFAGRGNIAYPTPGSGGKSRPVIGNCSANAELQHIRLSNARVGPAYAPALAGP
jgi:hypothetical protein